MQQALAENGDELTKEVGGVFLVKVTKKESTGKKLSSWIIDAKNNGGSVRIAKPGKFVSFFINSIRNINLFLQRTKVIRQSS